MEEPSAAKYIREVNVHLNKMDATLRLALVYGVDRDTCLEELSESLWKARLYLPGAMCELGVPMYNNGSCSPRVVEV